MVLPVGVARFAASGHLHRIACRNGDLPLCGVEMLPTLYCCATVVTVLSPPAASPVVERGMHGVYIATDQFIPQTENAGRIALSPPRRFPDRRGQLRRINWVVNWGILQRRPTTPSLPCGGQLPV